MKTMKLLSLGLKIASVLLIIGSVLRFFMGLTFLHFFSTLMIRGLLPKDKAPFYCIAFAIAALSALALLVNGIACAMIASEPLLSHKSVKWGIISLIFCIAANVLQIVGGYGASAVYWITGVVIPVYFLILAVIYSRLSAKGYRLNG